MLRPGCLGISFAWGRHLNKLRNISTSGMAKRFGRHILFFLRCDGDDEDFENDTFRSKYDLLGICQNKMYVQFRIRESTNAECVELVWWASRIHSRNTKFEMRNVVMTLSRQYLGEGCRLVMVMVVAERYLWHGMDCWWQRLAFPLVCPFNTIPSLIWFSATPLQTFGNLLREMKLGLVLDWHIGAVT